jgi:ABC-2 type transport system ATP-binding protein
MSDQGSSVALEAKMISKGFKSFFGKRKEILLDISMRIEGDEIFGILGPNGSGKTTLLSIFSTLIYPDRGSLEILGKDARADTHAVRELINISTGKPNFPWSMTVRENLIHSAMMYGLHGRELSNDVERVMESFDLFSYEDVRFENLSTGLKQRMSLAKAMLTDPKVLFLDEPTTGLDPEIAMKTRSIIKKIHNEGVAIVITTHYMPEAEELCGQIAFLRNGRIIAKDTPKNMKRDLKMGDIFRIRYRGTIEEAAILSIPGVICVQGCEMLPSEKFHVQEAHPAKKEIFSDKPRDGDSIKRSRIKAGSRQETARKEASSHMVAEAAGEESGGGSADKAIELILDRSDETISKVMKQFARVEILDMEIEEPDLEDVFIELSR